MCAYMNVREYLRGTCYVCMCVWYLCSSAYVCMRVTCMHVYVGMDVFQTTPVGNGGHVGLFIDTPEIIPYIATPGTRRFDPSGAPLAAFPSPAVQYSGFLLYYMGLQCSPRPLW